MWKYGIYKDMIIFYWPLKQSSGKILNVESVCLFWIRTQMLPYGFYEEFMLPNSQFEKQKQDQELTVAQTMNSLLPNSDVNWRK